VPAWAQESQFQQDPVERFAARAMVALVILGMGIVLYSMIRYRGRMRGMASWIVLIAGVAVLPAISSLLGTVLVMERAEQVQFCASCHRTMKSYVDDLKNPSSNSLAAVHYKNRYIPANQCYECHTSYGLHGTVQAKMAGMIDTWKYYTGTYRLPIKMRTPYRNDDCLKCHAQSAKWLPIHKDSKEALFAGRNTCMECHAENNPAHTLRQQAARQ
jgi:nitrate/TMAO reductase-like tetraheme cytochrome c subunit